MLVTIGIAKLADGRFCVEVQRPQSIARAERHYSDVLDVRKVLYNFELPTDAVEARTEKSAIKAIKRALKGGGARAACNKTPPGI
jgi:hypothetical protein